MEKQNLTNILFCEQVGILRLKINEWCKTTSAEKALCAWISYYILSRESAEKFTNSHSRRPSQYFLKFTQTPNFNSRLISDIISVLKNSVLFLIILDKNRMTARRLVVFFYYYKNLGFLDFRLWLPIPDFIGNNQNQILSLN